MCFMKKAFYILLAIAFFSGCAGVQAHIPKTHSAPTSPSASAEAYSYYARGTLLMENGEYQEAEIAFKRALAIDPNATQVHAKLAELYLYQNRPEEAFAQITIALKNQPDEPYLLFLAGAIEMSRANFKSARKYLLKARKLRPGYDDVDFNLWRVDVILKKYDEAIEILTEFSKRYPDSADILYYLAEVHNEKGDKRKALEIASKSLELNPNFIPALLLVANINFDLGNFQSSAEYYWRILDLQPDNIVARQGMDKISNLIAISPSPQEFDKRVEAGAKLLDEKMFERAVKEFEDLHSIRPNNTLVAFYLGIAYAELGRKDDALKMFYSVPQESSLYPDTTVRRALILLEKKKFSEAVTALEPIASAYPNNKDVRLLLAFAYLNAERAGDAVELLEALHKQYPNDLKIYYTLGEAYGEAGKEDEAIRVMRAVLEIDPNNAPALNYIGYTFAEKGIRLEEAELLILKALKIDPDNPAIIDSLGWVYFQQGKLDKAVTELEKAYKLEPNDPTIAEHLADVYIKLNRKEEAVQLYKHALELKPRPKQKKRIEDKLSGLK